MPSFDNERLTDPQAQMSQATSTVKTWLLMVDCLLPNQSSLEDGHDPWRNQVVLCYSASDAICVVNIHSDIRIQGCFGSPKSNNLARLP